MKTSFAYGVAAIFGFAINAAAAADLPKIKSLDEYEAVMKNARFAVATAPSAPSWNHVADLYISSLKWSSDDCVVTLRSCSDENFVEDISSKCPSRNGYRILNIESSNRVVPPKESK